MLPSTKGHVLILGGTSDIAVALAARFARAGYGISLAARDFEKVQIIASDITIRYQIIVDYYQFDALAFASHEQFYSSLRQKPDIVICVFGLLGDQMIAQANWGECSRILDSNFTGAVSVLNIIANDFEKRQYGTIIGISSVAGERGRQSNYLYGSAKAGFTTYLSGLRNRLFRSNVHVLTVKPGFMKTRMIEGMKTPGPLTASPDSVANYVFKASLKKRNSIYVLPVWALVMLIIKLIPEEIFKRLKL